MVRFGSPNGSAVAAVILGVALSAVSASLRLHARERQPLQKKNVEIGQPQPVSPELEGYDKDGKPMYWDPKPRVVPLGDGKYALKWFGHKGRELTLIYQRPDAIDSVVEASAIQVSGTEIGYTYTIPNLRTSKQNLGGFVVQTFSSAARPRGEPGIYATDMARFVKEFQHGRWVAFGLLTYPKRIDPGQQIVVVLDSPDLPGLLECRVHGGDATMKGVGEEPPTALEDLYLRHDAWPHGYTIGPDERISKMPAKARMQYLTQHLPQMLELGWIEDKPTMQWYKDKLQAGKVVEVRARAQRDFAKNLITSEVVGLITYLTR